jgi:triacylglycerol esterase/lipase EstA (alpha/beta hydrolase family)
VEAAKLRQALSCTENLANATRAPVLLVPGTMVTPHEHFSWNYMRSFDQMGWPYCSVTTPKNASGDMQIAGEYVVHAIRTMHKVSGRRIALLGGSQGGSLPRWALRFWPDTRAMVDDHIGLAPTNHGGQAIARFCVPNCAPAIWQQIWGSDFMLAMNSGQQTFPGISYTEVYSHHDRVVTPADDDTGASSLHGGGGRITNVALQDICPANTADHNQTASYDPVGYALAIDALTHDGPADPVRIDGAVCTQLFPPGVDPATFPTAYAHANAVIWYQLITADRTDEEPPLRCYVRTEGCQRGG